MASAAGKSPAIEVEVGDRDVRISNPDRVYFPATGATKLDLVEYYLAVGDGIVNALRERPCMLHRFPTGVTGEKVHQKRLPAGAPPWVETVRLHFPRYEPHADELCVTELASVIWAVQMSTVEFHPWNSRRADTEKPDEWRIDLDPMPECDFATVRRVAHVAHEVLDELGAVGLAEDLAAARACTSTCASSPTHGFGDVRRAALAFAREVERRAADDVTTTWWRKDRDPAALFVDYNQNARDHTIAAAYSVRGSARRRRCRRRSAGTRSTTSLPATSRWRPCPRASPSWATCTPASTTRCSPSTPLLEWADRDERDGADGPADPDAGRRRGDHPEVAVLGDAGLDGVVGVVLHADAETVVLHLGALVGEDHAALAVGTRVTMSESPSSSQDVSLGPGTTRGTRPRSPGRPARPHP